VPLDDERFFYRTGRRSTTALRPVSGAALRPALFARFGDLTALRYDFPVVLVRRPDAPTYVETLSGLIDDLLSEIAPPGMAGERLRRNVLRLEREIRMLVTGGADAGADGSLPAGTSGGRPVTFDALWSRAQERLVSTGGEPVASDLSRARSAMQVGGRLEGELADCDAALPVRFVSHAWRAVQERKTEQMRRSIETLLVTLGDLVKADFLRSEAGRQAVTLSAGVGAVHRELFDFEVMARLLAAPSGASALPESRRRRIDETVEVLHSQRFFGVGAHEFTFDRVDAALAAYRERLPSMAQLVRAIAVAELEVQGRYNEANHDDYFNSFDATSIGPEELALFPDYLVTLGAQAKDAASRTQLFEALASEAPIKILLETDDPFGLGGQLATTAMGLSDVYVLQSTSSHLFALRDWVRAAIAYSGPALLSIFTGALEGPAHLPPYLVAAAALESRAFPAFTYDPSAGPDWAQRFSLLDNPQPEHLWPVHQLTYADAAMHHMSGEVAFTPVDLALCDPRRADHFASAPRDHWADGLVSVDAWLNGSEGTPDGVPFVYAVDPLGRLAKVAVDDSLIREARRCADAWHRLQQLDEFKRERIAPGGGAPEADTNRPAGGAGPAPAVTAAVPAPADTPAAETAAPGEIAEPERDRDEPCIETTRCTTCNECTEINSRMFAYNDNRQAFIADPTAGTYRELVEAAEGCQVAIIHPGKPRNPNEPGLEELLARAEPFR